MRARKAASCWTGPTHMRLRVRCGALIDDKETLQEMRRAAKAEAARCDFAAYRANIEQVLQGMGI